MTIDKAVCSLTGLRSVWKRTSILFEKSFLAARRIFGRMAMLTSKIAVYGTTPTHTMFTRWQYIHKKLLFGADFSPAALLVHTFLKDTLVRPSPSTASTTE